jgi:hypothetical protein
MIARKAGKVLVLGRASALRGMKREVPLGRLVGPVFPVCGGWVPR